MCSQPALPKSLPVLWSATQPTAGFRVTGPDRVRHVGSPPVDPMLRASFDQYARYAYLYRLRHESYGAPRLRILDVGDPFGTIAPLFPLDETVSIDVYADDPVRDGHAPLIGSGFELPFKDAAFDLVACHDVFEHLPADRRNAFVAELLRVSRGPVVIVAPFADPRVARCEAIVNGYWVSRLGHSLPALDEHAEFGLPSLEDLTGWLRAQDVDFRAHGDGWLYHWVAFWLLKGHLAYAGLEDELHQVDAAFNTLLRDEDRRAPHYRRAVVLRPPVDYPDGWQDVAEPGDVPGDLDRLAGLATSLQRALPRGDDPWGEHSVLRRWIADHADAGGDDDDPYAVVARSLRTALDAVERERPGPVEPAPEPEPELHRRSVAIVLVNLNGADHLPDCLDSIAALDYPKDLLEVICVDNASTDGSRELLASRYPWVRVLPQDTNTGFAPAVNTGVRAATAECVVLLNNDARVDPEFVTELVRAYDPDRGVVCVGAQIRSWDGSHLDFGEGATNFYGMGQQLGYGTPIDTAHVEDGRELLFACGGAMLCGRDVFCDVGGLDPAFFAYFEDVDLGWRLWILGFRVVLAARAHSYHRMHGTSSRFPLHQRFLLYERNALRMLLKNYDDRNLERLLGPALLLMVKRAVLRGGLPRGPYDIGGDRAETEEVPRLTLAHLHAITDVVDDIENVMVDRATIQRARKRSDAEVFEHFNRPLWPVLPERPYLEASERVTTAFRLDEVFPHRRATEVLVISNDGLGEKMSGPAIRAFELAKALAGTAHVTVAVPEPTDVTAPNVSTAAYTDAESLVRLAEAADVTVVQGYTLHRVPGLARVPTLLVVDLYDPWIFENIELHNGEPYGDRALQGDVAVLNELLDTGDFFICASERQRDYWLGMLAARDRLTLGHYGLDPNLRKLIDVVPFGLPERAPRHQQQVLKGVHPKIGKDDLVVLWGGGTWDWFDPVSTIEAFGLVVKEVPNAKLYFLGFQLSSPNVKEMHTAKVAQAKVEELGLQDSVVFGDWAPYELREAYLLEADVAVTAARDLAETRLSFRTRVLDYLWAGLPVVATEGDVLADLVRDEKVGLVVPPEDWRGMAAALARLLGSPLLRAEASANARRVAERFRWRQSVEPLRQVVLRPWEWEESRRLRPRGRDITEEVRALLADRNRLTGAYAGSRLEGRILFRDRHFDSLEQYVQELEATVQHLNRRMEILRRTPIAPAFRAARKARNVLRRQG